MSIFSGRSVCFRICFRFVLGATTSVYSSLKCSTTLTNCSFWTSNLSSTSVGVCHSNSCECVSRYKLPSQQHFYMEPQGTVVLPDEAGTFTVTSSTQSPDAVQKAVAETLGIPWHKVTAVCRRVGGGFGGKTARSMPVAAACAVAAHKLGKQVRLSYNRNTDFRQNGGESVLMHLLLAYWLACLLVPAEHCACVTLVQMLGKQVEFFKVLKTWLVTIACVRCPLPANACWLHSTTKCIQIVNSFSTHSPARACLQNPHRATTL